MSKTILVLGASSDVGKCLLKKIAPNYEKIYAHYNSSKAIVDELIEEFGNKIIPLQADLLNSDNVQSLVKKIQDDGIIPNHIVHLASPKVLQKRFHQIDINEFSNGLLCSVLSFANILKPFINKMMGGTEKSKIVVMLSSYTENIPPKFISSYITAKYALLGLTKALSAEYASKAICINAVSPDMMETKFLSSLPAHSAEQYAEKSTMGRLLTPNDVIPTFVYLLSEDSDCVTGQNILISGVK